jgi:arylsulfatase A-like enzyme
VAALPEVRGTEDPRPNVIVIVTDDQSDDSIPNPYEVMPFLQGRALDPRDHWIVFENGYVNTPLCCPSRATMLTGRFSHHTGVRDNEDAAPVRRQLRRSRRGCTTPGYHTDWSASI